MKMRRIVSAEGKAGVVMQASDILDTETADGSPISGGSTSFPSLPLTPSKCSVNTSGMGSSGQRTSPRRRPIIAPGDGQPGATDLGPLIAKLDLGRATT